MNSPRALGAIALIALGVAAVSFALVDVTVVGACDDAACRSGIPPVAIVFAALGVLAALVSIVPTVLWIVQALRAAHHHHEDHDREYARVARARRAFADDEF